MARYGTDIAILAKILADRYLQSEDPSQDVIIHLALAFAAVKRLEEKGADLEFRGQHLISPAIERAYREALHVRLNQPVEMLDVTLISRYGRVTGEDKTKSNAD